MTPAERDARILSLRPQVWLLARTRKQSMPSSVGLDELVSAAWLGAIQAVDAFDSGREKTLGTYAEWKIRSAIADYLRSLDPLSRHHRHEVKHGDRAAPVLLSLTPMPRNDGKPDTVTLIIQDHRAPAALRATEARIDVEKIFARAKLEAHTSRILKRWIGGETQKIIGISTGKHHTRISQICGAALAALRIAA